MKIRYVLASLFISLAAATGAWCAPTVTYVAEFTVSGADKPEEIKGIVRTLLLSRLASDKVSTVTTAEGAKLKITGSYLQSGTVFSLDAAVVNDSGAVVSRVFNQGKSTDDLIPAVTALAKALTEGIEKNLASSAAVTAPAPDIIKAAPAVPTPSQVIHNLKGALGSMALGRVLPNGERELFVAGNQVLRYYRLAAELKLMAEVPYKVYEKLMSVDTADLDGDGVPEVYVTMMTNDIVTSQVWSVEGATLKKTAGPLPYFFRSVTTLNGSSKLYAQLKSDRDSFAGAVAEVVKTGSSYALKDEIRLPPGGYLYNFTLLKGSAGEVNPAIIDSGRSLRAYSPKFDELWKSSEEFGGSEIYFNGSTSDPGGSINDGLRKIFFEQRMIVTSAGALLVPRNTESWRMRNKHYYSGSSLYSFSWNGSGLQEKWHTPPSDRYLADFAFDNSSRELLMLEVVEREEGLFDKGASRLVIRKVE